jgi:PBSX family phage terminase large subunit
MRLRNVILGIVLMATASAMLQAVDLRWPARNDGIVGPSAKQLQFINCSAKEQLGGGAKRGGKGIVGSAKAILLSVLFPGNRGLIGRQAFTDLRDSTMVSFFQMCPPELILDHNKTEHRLILRTRDPKRPSEIIYRGIGEDSTLSKKAKDKQKSIELGWLWLDEASECSFDAYRQLLAQLCWRLPDGRRPPYMAMLTSNPEPGWVKDRFVDASSQDYVIDPTDPAKAAFIQFLPRDNPGLPPGWEDELRKSMDPDWVRRYLDGSWDIHEGMVFTELSEEVHDLDRYIDPKNGELWTKFHWQMRHISSLDYASTGIMAYVMTGIDSSENCFGLESIYEKDKLISEYAKMIKLLDSRYGSIDYRLVDPSTENKTLQNREEMISVQDAYDREGINLQSAIRSEIRVGIDLIKQYLHFNPLHINPFTQKLGSPRLWISKSRNPAGWKEMVGLKTEVKPNGTIVYKGADHWIDNLRYILMSRPAAAELKRMDIQKLPTHDQIAVKSMDRFFENWGREDSGEGSWF